MRGLGILVSLLLCWGFAQAATVGEDTFTNTNGTALTDHTPDTGAGWAVSAANFTIQSDELNHATTVLGFARKGDNLGTDRHRVSASCKTAVSGSRFCGIMGRMPLADFNNGFYARLRAGSVVLGKRINGTDTDIPGCTWAGGLSANQFYALALEIDDGEQRVYVDTVLRITCTEPNTTLAGNHYAGIMMNCNSVAQCRLDTFASATLDEPPPTSRFLHAD